MPAGNVAQQATLRNERHWGSSAAQTRAAVVVAASAADCVNEACYVSTEPKETSQYSTGMLTVVRVMIAKYRKSGIWGYRSSLTPEPVELK